jgi:3-phosphoshikimate 1-carboxyvinyltransferase
MERLVLQPIRHVAGTLVLPGSKSMSNRALLLAALASGTTRIQNLLVAADVQHMLGALATLGVSVAVDGTSAEVVGRGAPLDAARAQLFLGNAGTALRPLCAVLCLGRGEFLLEGEPRMYERPIAHLVTALRQAGAHIRYLGHEGFPPLAISAAGLRGGPVTIDGSVSSQFLTALLMAAPLFETDTRVEVAGTMVSRPYVEMTLSSVRQFGGVIEAEDARTFRVPARQRYVSPGDFLVEGDASSASYFLAAAAIRGGTVRVVGVGEKSVQGDARFADVLGAMGAVVRRGPDWIEVSRGTLVGIDVDAGDIPDAAMTLGTTALFAQGRTVIRNVGNWRVKESDRLSAMATELRKVGATVDEGRDSLAITPPARIVSAAIDTYHDHRMAMCFSLAALGDAPITIHDPGCTAKTFPDFFATLARLAGNPS